MIHGNHRKHEVTRWGADGSAGPLKNSARGEQRSAFKRNHLDVENGSFGNCPDSLGHDGHQNAAFSDLTNRLARDSLACRICSDRIECQRALDDPTGALRTANRFQPQALGRAASRSRAGALTAPDRDRSTWSHSHEPSAGPKTWKLPERSSISPQILVECGTCYHRVSTLDLRWGQSD